MALKCGSYRITAYKGHEPPSYDVDVMFTVWIVRNGVRLFGGFNGVSGLYPGPALPADHPARVEIERRAGLLASTDTYQYRWGQWRLPSDGIDDLEIQVLSYDEDEVNVYFDWFDAANNNIAPLSAHTLKPGCTWLLSVKDALSQPLKGVPPMFTKFAKSTRKKAG